MSIKIKSTNNVTIEGNTVSKYQSNTLNPFKKGDYVCTLPFGLSMDNNFFKVDEVKGNQIKVNGNSIQYDLFRFATEEEIKAQRRL